MSNKTGIRKGKDFIKNMEKLKKIYGGKIPKNLTIEEADATLKKVKPIKNKAGNMVLSPKADLDGDGTFSEYERKRGMAIQNAMAKNKKPEGAFIGKLFSQDKMKEMFPSHDRRTHTFYHKFTCTCFCNFKIGRAHV